MPPTIMQQAFLRIEQLSIDLPDVTIGIVEFEVVNKGWVVKIKGQQHFEGKEGMAKAFFLARDTTKTISGWKSGKAELWDVCEIFDNEDEATKAGIENEQMAIYQIETGRLKWIS